MQKVSFTIEYKSNLHRMCNPDVNPEVRMESREIDTMENHFGSYINAS
jgi:hypothetical protein